MVTAQPSPTFSVIMAVFNGATTIGRAIDSVLSQTYPACELIVIDDGSTDNTAEVVRNYADSVRYLYQPNSGVSAARNKGVEIATGEWLAFLDADDYYYPDRLRLHADWIQQGPPVDFLTGNFDYRRPDGSLMGSSMENTESGRLLLKKSTGNGKVIMADHEIGYFVEHHFGDTRTLSVPRKMFLSLGGFSTRFQVCEDVHLLIRLCAKSNRIGVVCQPMAAYVIFHQSVIRSDPFRAQQQTIAALLDLKVRLSNAPAYIRSGIEGALRRARLNFAYLLLRSGKRIRAVRVALPLLVSQPGLKSLRDVTSILRGLH